jgi:hypothetical protein
MLTETKILVFIIGMLMLIQTAAAEIIVQRTMPEEVELNQEFDITISLENQFNQEVEVEVVELLTGLLDPTNNFDNIIISEPIEGIAAFQPEHYSWTEILPPRETVDIKYSVQAIIPAEVRFSAARVYTDDTEYESETSILKVLCNQNNLCEENEDFINCPHDCQSGGEDGICDLVNDGIIDSDCEPGFDSSEIIDYCKNEILDFDEEGVDCGGVCETECDLTCSSGFFRILSSCKSKEQIIQDWKTGVISTNALMQSIKSFILPSL